jgi:serine/threonine protein kinase
LSTSQGNPPVDRAGSPNALPSGTRLGDFEVTGIIGEGGFGIVYVAFDNSLHRKVAVKEYMPSALANRMGDFSVAVRSDSHEQTFRAGLRSFINEARLLAQFDHPALIKVYAFWEQHGTAYMAMQLYEGRTLKDVLRESPRPDEAWLKSLLSPLLDALETLHAAQCYHRDIAPDNILILRNGNPVLLDFGAARRIIGDMTQAVTVILKPGYAPIEQYADDATMQQGPWTDVYALSAVLHLAMTGKAPPASVTRMINDPMRPLRATVPGYSEQFLSAVERGLSVRPEQRPQSIAEFRELLGVSTLGPGAGSWTMSPAPGGTTRPGPTTTMRPGPTTTFETPRSGPPSAPTEFIGNRPVSIPVSGPPRDPVSAFGVSGIQPAGAAPIAGDGGPGMPVLPPTELLPASAGGARAPRPPAGDRVPKIPGAALAVVVGLAAIGIALGIYYAITTSRPPLTTTTVKTGSDTMLAPPSAPAVAPATSPGSSATESPAARPPIIAAPTPAVVVPPPDPDEAAWQNARSVGTKDAIDDYLKRFPTGKNAAAAKTEQARIAAANAPTTVRINLAIKPWGNVSVNGVPQGASPPIKKLDLEEGKYKIELSNGSQSFSQQVEVKRGQKAISIAHQFN